LFDQLLPDAADYLGKVRRRIEESTSKVLVTGDLNAGKSTFINAMMNCDFLPVDQQPCTQSFCEVLIAKSPELIGTVLGSEANPALSAETSVRLTVSQLQSCLQDENSKYRWFRLYASGSLDEHSTSAIEVSFIDSPGLNTDVLKTTALFCQQGDIDVIVFVVNAAFHLTLSAREFLLQAAKEKSKIFVVVNRFDEIVDRKRCRALILKQIEELLPDTFSESSKFIHFISAREYIRYRSVFSRSSEEIEHQPILPAGQERFAESFQQMKEALFGFIYARRSVSKLLPAKTFTTKLLQDLLQLSSTAYARYDDDLRSVDVELLRLNSEFAHATTKRPSVIIDTNQICEAQSGSAKSDAKNLMCAFVKSIGGFLSKDRCTSIFRIHSYLRRIHGSVSCAYSRLMQDLNERIESHIEQGRQELLSIARTNEVDSSGVLSARAFSRPRLQSSCSLSAFYLLDVLDPLRVLRHIGIINIVSISTAAISYQPLFRFIWQAARRTGVRPWILGTALVSSASVYFAYTMSSAICNSIQSHLELQLNARFNSDMWMNATADQCQQAVFAELSSLASRIAHAYEQVVSERSAQAYSFTQKREMIAKHCNFLNSLSRRVESMVEMTNTVII
jgi:GTPase SAR1 family protein